VAPENSIPAFVASAAAGATGLESDAWITIDGIPVLDHDGLIRRGRRRYAIRALVAADLPTHIPCLQDLYAAVGTKLHLSLDIKDPSAASAVVATAQAAGGSEALDHLWLCSPDWRAAASWRNLSAKIRLVHSARARRLGLRMPQHILAIASSGIDVLNMPHSDWSAATISLTHDAGLRAFAWGCNSRGVIESMISSGVDAIYCDDVDLMLSCIR
jgi:glycerophosphoryl diester phosphodiesterase